MSLIGQILGEERARVTGGISPRDPDIWLQGLWGAKTKSGVSINESSAMTISAYWNGVNIISGAVGMLPFKLFRREPDGGRQLAPLHPTSRLIEFRANPYMDALTFQETLQGHLLGWGNAYAEIERDGSGQAINLWPLSPKNVRPVVEGPENNPQERVIAYKVIDGGREKTISFDNMFHLKGLSPDGLQGYSVIHVARESLGIAKATEDYGAVFFKNNATPPAVLEHPGKLGDKSKKHLKKSVDDEHAGLENQHKLMILEEGMKLHTIGLPPQDAQLLASRQFSVIEIARWIDIPPHMLKSLEGATFSNIEHQGIEFVVWTLTKWLSRWETEVDAKLLTERDRALYFSRFSTAALLRGDTKSRYDAYRVAINSGWLNRNQARAFEDMNKVDGLDGFWQPVNVVSIGEDGEAQVPTSTVVTMLEAASRGQSLQLPAPASDVRSFDEDEESASKYRDIFDATWRRIVTKEVNSLKRVLKKCRQHQEDPKASVNEFYQRHHGQVVEMLGPVLRIFHADDDVVTDIAKKYVEDSRADIIQALDGGDPDSILSEWASGKAARMAEEMLERRSEV